MIEWEFFSIIISLIMTSKVFEAAVPKKKVKRLKGFEKGLKY